MDSNISNFNTDPTFPQFWKLPPEIRTTIWRMSLGEPRVVDTDWGVPPDWSKFYKSVPDAGPLLHVNREARAEALNLGIIGVPDVLRKSTIYVNPNKDIFYFGHFHEVWLDPRTLCPAYSRSPRNFIS